jgi:hypothetical protein
VIALMERYGGVRLFPIERATLKHIEPIVEKHVDPETHLVTDDSPVYYMMKPEFSGTRLQERVRSPGREPVQGLDEHGRSRFFSSTERSG